MSPPRRGRHFAYADLSDAEFAVVRAAADAEHLTIADFVRRCVNNYLVELSEDGLLLAEHGKKPRLPRGTVRHDGGLAETHGGD